MSQSATRNTVKRSKCWKGGRATREFFGSLKKISKHDGVSIFLGPVSGGTRFNARALPAEDVDIWIEPAEDFDLEDTSIKLYLKTISSTQRCNIFFRNQHDLGKVIEILKHPFLCRL